MDIDEYPLFSRPNVMLVALKTAARGPVRPEDCRRQLDADLRFIREPLPDDTSEMERRIADAYLHLLIAGLLDLDDDGRFVITARGEKMLAAHPTGIDDSVLEQFAEYREFLSRPYPRPERDDEGPVAEPRPQFDYGYASYWRGRDITDNPFDSDTVEHLEWENGWSEAQNDAAGRGG